MKKIIFLISFIAAGSALANCPNILSGKYDVRAEKSLNHFFDFPNEDRISRIHMEDGIRVELKQNGCDSVEIKITQAGHYTEAGKLTLSLLADTEQDDFYKAPEKVEWTQDGVTFSRSAGKWPSYRKYNVSMKKTANGEIVVTDKTTGCAPIPAPIPATWTQKIVLVPVP